MRKRRNRVCGADVHKDLIVATIQSSDGTGFQEKFGMTSAELERFRDWLIAHNCERAAFEATDVYWFSVYDALNASIDRAHPKSINPPSIFIRQLVFKDIDDNL